MDMLSDKGFDIHYRPGIQESEVISVISAFEAMIVRSKFFLGSVFFEKAVNLRVVGRAGAGLDGIDQEAAAEHGVSLLHAAEGNADAVAEHTLGMMLGLLSRIASADRTLRNGIWDREKFRGTELRSKTVGLLGYGNMGRAVAARLQSFGCRVLAYDKYLEVWPDENAERTSLEILQKESDILSLHIPLTPETRFWIDQTFLSSCKKGMVFINTSRGKIVKTSDLELMLENGWLSAAGLDVFETEPVEKMEGKFPEVFCKLFSMENVLLTPHVAGWSLESYEKISHVLAGKILDFFDPKNVKYGPNLM
jgi:D-3-phosphoglycerate dehydrogenase